MADDDKTPPAWWPPCPGDRLRHFTHRTVGTKVKPVHAVAHVCAVFEHPATGETLATVAHQAPGAERWTYATISAMDSWPRWSKYWPDGQDPPTPHDGGSEPCRCQEE